jgi:glycosyltransferase involved in cell wall biosynthesis
MEIRCSIVIPSYNEKEVLRKTLSRISETLEIEFECLIVVDEISDTSVPIIRDFQSRDPRFILLVNDLFPGPAGAIRSGIRKASGRTIVVTSADGSDDASQIVDLVMLVERGIDVAAASRYMHGGKLINSPFLKGLLSRVAGLSLHILKRVGTRDATNNFRGYSADFLRSIEIESIYGFEIGLELVAKALRARRPIAEIPTIWIERESGISKFPLLKSLPRYLYWYLFALAPKGKKPE